MTTSTLRVMAGSDGLFETFQGEGKYAGMPSLFLRTAGCDLRCARKDGQGWSCDTPHSLPDFDVSQNALRAAPTRFAQDVDVVELAQRIWSYGATHLVITGGEPTLQAGAITYLLSELDQLWLKARDVTNKMKVTLETNGRRWVDFLSRVDLVSVSPKVYQPQTIDQAEFAELCDAAMGLQVKIVMVSPHDKEAMDHALHLFTTARKISPGALLYVQQAWDTVNDQSAQLLRDWVVTSKVARELGIRYGMQLHKYAGVA